MDEDLSKLGSDKIIYIQSGCIAMDQKVMICKTGLKIVMNTCNIFAQPNNWPTHSQAFLYPTMSTHCVVLISPRLSFLPLACQPWPAWRESHPAPFAPPVI